MARTPKKIRTPLKQQWRQIRYRFLPVVVFTATVASTVVLWQNHAGPSGLRGRAQARSATISSPVSAAILPLPGAEQLDFDSIVIKNQRIVMFDTAIIDKRIEAATAELHRREEEKKWRKQEFETAAEEHAQAVRVEHLRKEAERARLFEERRGQRDRIVEHQSQIKIAEAEKTVVEKEAASLKKLENFVLPRGVTAASKRLEAIKWQVHIDEGRKAIKSLQEQIVEVELSLESLGQLNPPQVSKAQLDTALSPFQEAVVVQQKLIEQLKAQKDTYIIKSPFDGMITNVLKWPGQTVEPGEIIFEISATDPEYIVAYVRQGPHKLPRVGDVVDVRLRTRPPQVDHGLVVQIGAKFELVPVEHLRDPRFPEWGYPVRIEIPNAFVGKLLPGESVDLTFAGPSSDGAGIMMITGR